MILLSSSNSSIYLIIFYNVLEYPLSVFTRLYVAVYSILYSPVFLLYIDSGFYNVAAHTRHNPSENISDIYGSCLGGLDLDCISYISAGDNNGLVLAWVYAYVYPS